VTPKQQTFVREYLLDLNASAAAKRAGYRGEPGTIGPRLLGNVGIQAEIAREMAERATRTGITADNVLKALWTKATADARQLVEFRRNCCRFCYGQQFRYQRTAGEMERDRALHERKREKAEDQGKPDPGEFDEQGGIGYHGKADPNPECPECFGDGIGEVFVHDTRKFSSEASTLYAGVKQTKDGLEIKLHSQDEALVNCGRHLGLFKDKVELDATVRGSVTYKATIPTRGQA
jgi:phage terminase small subunit